MKNLIRKILKESGQDKFIDTMINRIKSGLTKPPYFKNLDKFGAEPEEIEMVLNTVFGGYIKNKLIYDINDRLIYREYSDDGWRKFQYDENGNEIFRIDDTGEWRKFQYNERGHKIYRESSYGDWQKWERDETGETTYFEDSTGYWLKQKYDKTGNTIYFEDSDQGVTIDIRK